MKLKATSSKCIFFFLVHFHLITFAFESKSRKKFKSNLKRNYLNPQGQISPFRRDLKGFPLPPPASIQFRHLWLVCCFVTLFDDSRVPKVKRTGCRWKMLLVNDCLHYSLPAYDDDRERQEKGFFFVCVCV